MLADTNSFYDMAPSGIQALLRIADGDAAQPIFDNAVVYNKMHFWTAKTRGSSSPTATWNCRSLDDMPMFNVSRASMLKALCEAVEALDPNCIRFETAFESIDHINGLVHVSSTSSPSSSSSEPLQADLIVAADGIHSKIRKRVFGDSGLRSDGIAACYATLPPLSEEELQTFPRVEEEEEAGKSYCVVSLETDLLEYAVITKAATIWYANFIVDGEKHTSVPPAPEHGWLEEAKRRCMNGIPQLEALIDRSSEKDIQVVMCNDR